MTTRDLDRLAKYVKAHRLELYPSRLTAAQAAGISKDTWQRVEVGKSVQEGTYAKIDKALGWAKRSCVSIAEGGEPVLVDRPGGDVSIAAPSAPPAPISADAMRRAAFEAARAKLPGAPIGDIDAFSDEITEGIKESAGDGVDLRASL